MTVSWYGGSNVKYGNVPVSTLLHIDTIASIYSDECTAVRSSIDAGADAEIQSNSDNVDVDAICDNIVCNRLAD